MKKFFKVTYLVFVVLVIGVIQSATAETLRVAFECTYAPFNYRTASGELDGYDVDVAKGVLELIGEEMEPVCQKWDGMIPSLLANKFDLIVASMSITNSRLKKMDFSAPYRVSIGRLIGKKNANLNLFKNDDPSKPIPANFKGLRVGVERASTYANWFKAKIPEANLVFYDTNAALFMDLENGRTDMIITNPMKAFLKFLSKENGKGFEFVSPAIDEVEYFGIGVGIGLRKGNDKLLERLNMAVNQLIKNGSLTKYALKYFPFPIHNEKWGQ
jgi:polar amino acid transport system substrate-binding protein